MAQPIHEAAVRRPSTQFGIRTALVIVCCFSIGASALREEGAYWSIAALLVVAACFVFGLSHEIFDLLRSLRRHSGMPLEMRDGLRLAIACRLGIVLLLVGHYVVEYILIRHGLLQGPHVLIEFDQSNGLTRPILLVSMIMVVASGTALRRGPATLKWWRRMISWAAWPLAAILALIVWTDQSSIHGLVFFAVRGVENALPLHAPGLQQAQLNITAARSWPLLSGAAAICCGLSLIALCWTFDSERRTAWRLLAAIALSVCLPTSLLLVWRLLSQTLPNLSTSFTQATIEIPFLVRGTALILTLVMATILAVRLGVDDQQSQVRPEEDAAISGSPYLHNRRFILLLATLAGLGYLIESYVRISTMPMVTAMIARIDLFVWTLSSPLGMWPLRCSPVIDRCAATARRTETMGKCTAGTFWRYGCCASRQSAHPSLQSSRRCCLFGLVAGSK